MLTSILLADCARWQGLQQPAEGRCSLAPALRGASHTCHAAQAGHQGGAIAEALKGRSARV